MGRSAAHHHAEKGRVDGVEPRGAPLVGDPFAGGRPGIVSKNDVNDSASSPSSSPIRPPAVSRAAPASDNGRGIVHRPADLEETVPTTATWSICMPKSWCRAFHTLNANVPRRRSSAATARPAGPRTRRAHARDGRARYGPASLPDARQVQRRRRPSTNVLAMQNATVTTTRASMDDERAVIGVRNACRISVPLTMGTNNASTPAPADSSAASTSTSRMSRARPAPSALSTASRPHSRCQRRR